MPVRRITRFFSDLLGRCLPAQGGTGLDASAAANGQTLVGTGSGLALIKQHWSLKAGGAVGDGTADDTAAIRAVLTAAGVAGGSVTAEAGTYVYSGTMAVPPIVTVRGMGRNATTFRAAPGFGGPAFTLASFSSRLESMTIDCNFAAGSVGVFSDSINEQSGLYNVCVVNFARSGFRVDGTGSSLFPQGYAAQYCEFYMDSGSVYSAPACIELTDTFPANFDNCTLNATVAGQVPANSAGARLIGNVAAINFTSLHAENLVLGIDGLTSNCQVDHFNIGPNVVTGIGVATGANNFSIRGATPSGSVQSTLVDPDRGYSSGNQSVTWYAISGGAAARQTRHNVTPDGTSQVPNLVVTEGGTFNGPLCLTNDPTGPNVLAINAVDFSGENQGGFISINSKFGFYPNWFKTSTAASNNAMFVRYAATNFEVRFGAAGNAQGSNPGTSAFMVTAAGVTVPTRLITAASATTAAGLSVPPGAAPTSPVDGDVWTTTSGVFARINGSTVGPFGVAGSGGFTGTYTPHSAFGGSAVVDGTSLVPGTSFPVPLGTVLEVSEHITATRFAGVGNYLEYSPAADGGILRAGATSLALDAANTHAVTLLIGEDLIVTLGGSGNIVEADGLETIVDNYSTGTVNIIKAIGAETWHETSGTLTKGYGLYAFVGNFGSGTVTHGSAIFVDTPANTGGGAITTCCGIEIADQTVGTTGYAIKTGLGPVQFGDRLTTSASTTARAGLNLPHGAAPTSPVNGDIWTTTAGTFARVNGTTVGPFGAGGAGMAIGGTIGSSPVDGDILVVGTGGVLGQLPATTYLTPTGNGSGLTALNASNLGSGTVPVARIPNPSATTLGGIQSITTVTHQFLTGISTSGVPSQAQPAFTDLSGTATAAQLPNPSASTLGGVESIAAVTHQFLTGISTSGVPSQAQPAFTDISGSVAATQLPNPSASTLGGVQSAAAVTHQWINAISTSGVPALSQPAFTDISGTATSGQIPDLSATYVGIAGTQTITGAKSFTTRTRIDARTAVWQQFTVSGGAFTIDWSLGGFWYGTLGNGANAPTYTNAPAAGTTQPMILRLKQPASGAAGTISPWPTGSKFPGGTAPTLTATNGAVDHVSVILDPGGTLFETFLVGANLS